MRHWLRCLPLFFILVATSATGKTTYPKPQGHVNDFAGVITSSTRNSLETLLTGLAARTGAEIAVVTLPSLNEEPIENVAVDLFKEWGIGQKGKDNGLLFLVAPNDRKMRIEVGYGLEPILPDALTGRVLDTYVVPEFKKGDLTTGIQNGTVALVQTLAKYYDINPEELSLPKLPQASSHPPKKESLLTKLFRLGFIIFLIVLFIRHPSLFLALLLSGMGGGGGRSSGGFGGGFGGFGGGSSGGGGSGRSW
jgi:uncharacterized protein